MTFKELGLQDNLIAALNKQGITEPTSIQEQTYDKIINNANVIARSQTGSGKTLAYLLPIYAKIDENLKSTQAIILVPTHELAMQVHKQVELLSKNANSSISSAVIIGNANIERQIDALKKKPAIVIGTAGRIHELIKKRKIAAHTTKTIVIDEADRMLDQNNINAVKDVRKTAMRDTQVLLFSASINDKTIKSAHDILTNPVIIQTSEKTNIPTNIERLFLVVEQRDKLEMLRKLAKSINPKKAMVFINKAYDIEEATQKLKYHQYNAECIYGKVDKLKRKNTINAFINGKLQFLIATDIAARGLDIEGVTTIFNISMPEDPKDYLHRAGRCARNNEKGLCVSIITEQELPLIKSYQKAFGINILQKRLYQGKIVRK